VTNSRTFECSVCTQNRNTVTTQYIIGTHQIATFPLYTWSSTFGAGARYTTPADSTCPGTHTVRESHNYPCSKCRLELLIARAGGRRQQQQQQQQRWRPLPMREAPDERKRTSTAGPVIKSLVVGPFIVPSTTDGPDSTQLFSLTTTPPWTK